MAVYFLRHGQCKANLEEVFAGQGDDSELTELGFDQAATAGDTLAPLNIVRIISSNLVRASHTAETAGAKIGFEPKDIAMMSDLLNMTLGHSQVVQDIKLRLLNLFRQKGQRIRMTFCKE